jgi:replicative DNA helicase
VDIGARLLIALVALGDIILYRKLALKADYFFGAEIKLFNFVNDHVANYSQLPNLATLADYFKGLPAAPEPVKFYADLVEQRFAHKTLNTALVASTEHMKVMDTFTTENLMLEALIEVRSLRARTSLEEFKEESPDNYMALYHKKLMEDVPEVLVGWDALDKYGGLQAGDVMSIIGRPALGKTFSLLYIAEHGTFVQNLRVLFVSLEMPLTEIRERLIAMYSHFPMDHIQNYELSTAQLKKLPAVLMSAKKGEGKLWVLDGNFASTVEDVFALVYQLNPHVLMIDGAYLMRHPDPRMDRYRRAEVNMEMIKRRASEFGIPVLQTYQFNRQAVKKQQKSKGTEFGGLEDIAFSDSIGQISSVVLGLFEDESVETLKARRIHVLKGRKGQAGTFKINWNFWSMDFTQIMDDEQKKAGIFVFA